jgi:transposase
MDNMPAHRAPGVRELIEAAGTELRYLPPYSPNLNPIEAFSKLKAFLKKTAARPLDALWRAIAEALLRPTPQDGANYFRAAGYEPE